MIINQFALHHIFHKKPITQKLDQTSSANTTLYDASINNEHWMKIKQLAGGRPCATADYNGTNTKNASTLILGHFTPSGMKADQRGYGVLSTYETGEDPENTNREKEICYNSLPTNESVYTVYNNVAKVISNRYGLGWKDAQACSIELCAWVDILPVIMPHDAADPNSNNNNDYWEIRKKVDPHSMAYIQYVIEKLLINVEIIIAVGDHAFNFVEKMIEKGMIDSDKVKFLQHSPIAHPTKQLKFGLTIKQRHWFYQTITDMLTHILGENRVNVPSQEVMIMSEHRTNNNGDTHGNYVYYGHFQGKRILIGRSCAHFLQLLRDAYVSTGPFESQGTLLETEDRSGDIDGLEVKLVWYTKHNDELMEHDYRGLQFGYQFPLGNEIMKDWMKVAGEKQEKRLVGNVERKRPPPRNDASTFVRENCEDLDDLLDNIKENAAKSRKPG